MQSHPLWVRGLKHKAQFCPTRAIQSHPLWVRGLKRITGEQRESRANVASFMGAWIET